MDQALRVIENPVSKKIFEDAEIVFTDGKPIIWMAKWLKRPIVEKISGPDLMELLCERAAKKGYRIFLLGAGPGVAANAAKIWNKDIRDFSVQVPIPHRWGLKRSKGDGKNHLNVKKNLRQISFFVGMGSEAGYFHL